MHAPIPAPAPVVFVFDPTGTRRGVIAYRSLTVVQRYCDVGTWRITAPLTPQHAQAAAEGWRVVVAPTDGSTTVITSGYVEYADLELGTREATSGRRTVPTLTLSGRDDTAVLADRLAWPTPSAALDAQTSAYDVRTGQASTVMRGYVLDNAGSSARTERRVPGLLVQTDPLIGAQVTGRARFDVLLDLLRGLAVAGGIGFRVRYSPATGNKIFEMYTPRDLRGPARFSAPSGAVRYLRYTLAAPTATTVVAGGRGEETARQFIGITDPAAEAAWQRRIETFLDYRSASDTDDGAELTQAAQRRLAESTATRSVTMIPVDTPQMTYGRDYGLGDRVTVDVGHGITVDQVVTEVELTATRGGHLRAQPRVGDLDPGPRQWRLLRDALARLARLETR